MDFDITAEEEALALRIAERVGAGDTPSEDDLAEELGDEVRPQVRSLLAKGWLVCSCGCLDLSRMARMALSSRRDVGGAPQA
ncbi:hypothetical protein [Streptomyces sp. NPDC003077]|uniref:hypothetical protein n=1 Tax=Streptomyces sp. NPDC003077 TaxID=3154443 RepID=UPI0033A39CC5